MAKGRYNTKQREELLEYLKGMSGRHITVSDIETHFSKNGVGVGTTTIYRHLDRMVDEGVVKKYVFDGNMSACFEYIDEYSTCKESGCAHLKCIKCGKLIHLRCDELSTIGQHINDCHDFKIDMMRTVLYGVCKECQS